MIFPFIENKLNILRLKKNFNCTTVLWFLELLQNLRWVIIQDCKKTSFMNEINQCCLHLQRSLLSRADGRTVLDYLANNCEKYMYDIDSSIGLSWVIISPLILALNQDYVKDKMAMRII